MINLVKLIRSVTSLALSRSTHSWVCTLLSSTCQLKIKPSSCIPVLASLCRFPVDRFYYTLLYPICCHFLYRQSLADTLRKGDSEIQPIHSWIWLFAAFLSICRSNWLARLGLNQVQSELGVRGSRAWCVIISHQHRDCKPCSTRKISAFHW